MMILCVEGSSLPIYNGTIYLTDFRDTGMGVAAGIVVCGGFIHSTYSIYEFIPGLNLIRIL